MLDCSTSVGPHSRFVFFFMFGLFNLFQFVWENVLFRSKFKQGSCGWFHYVVAQPDDAHFLSFSPFLMFYIRGNVNVVLADIDWVERHVGRDLPSAASSGCPELLYHPSPPHFAAYIPLIKDHTNAQLCSVQCIEIVRLISWPTFPGYLYQWMSYFHSTPPFYKPVWKQFLILVLATRSAFLWVTNIVEFCSWSISKHFKQEQNLIK